MINRYCPLSGWDAQDVQRELPYDPGSRAGPCGFSSPGGTCRNTHGSSTAFVCSKMFTSIILINNKYNRQCINADHRALSLPRLVLWILTATLPSRYYCSPVLPRRRLRTFLLWLHSWKVQAFGVTMPRPWPLHSTSPFKEVFMSTHIYATLNPLQGWLLREEHAVFALQELTVQEGRQDTPSRTGHAEPSVKSSLNPGRHSTARAFKESRKEK